MIAHAVPNVFVPAFALQYAAMCERAEREPPECAQYGVSLEDSARTGIWVPLDWLTTIAVSPARRWQRFTDEEIMALYPKPQPQQQPT